MESSLHRTLKERYALGGSGRPEIAVEQFRVDAVDEKGRLIEVQSGALGPLRAKLRRLLPQHRVRIVKPIVLKRRVVRKSRPGGPILSARFSPTRGSLLDVFDDLIGMVRVFPHANLEIEVLGVAIDEIRIPRGGGRAIVLPTGVWARSTKQSRSLRLTTCGRSCPRAFIRAGLSRVMTWHFSSIVTSRSRSESRIACA